MAKTTHNLLSPIREKLLMSGCSEDSTGRDTGETWGKMTNSASDIQSVTSTKSNFENPATPTLRIKQLHAKTSSCFFFS